MNNSRGSGVAIIDYFEYFRAVNRPSRPHYHGYMNKEEYKQANIDFLRAKAAEEGEEKPAKKTASKKTAKKEESAEAAEKKPAATKSTTKAAEEGEEKPAKKPASKKTAKKEEEK